MRTIEGFENYSISIDGRVWNNKRRRWLADRTHKLGYKKASLSRNGMRFEKLVHRLVGSAYIANPQGLPYINHKNGNKGDNRIENLEWCTRRENSLHARDILRRFRSKLSRDQIELIQCLWKTSDFRQVDIGRLFDVSYRTIGAVVRGDSWSN